MRSLARYFDVTAQGALEGAVDDARHGASPDASFVFSIRAFARSAADFRRTIDEYEAKPFEVPASVDALAVRLGRSTRRSVTPIPSKARTTNGKASRTSSGA
jgi:hypothetical protein